MFYSALYKCERDRVKYTYLLETLRENSSMVTLLIHSGIYVLRSTSVQAGYLCHSVLTVSSPRSSTNSQLTGMLTTSSLPMTSQGGSSPSCTMACMSRRKRPAYLKCLHTKQDDSSGTTYIVGSKHQECSMHH